MPSCLACHQKSCRSVQTIGPEFIASISSQHPMAVIDEPATQNTRTFIHVERLCELPGPVELLTEIYID